MDKWHKTEVSEPFSMHLFLLSNGLQTTSRSENIWQAACWNVFQVLKQRGRDQLVLLFGKSTTSAPRDSRS